MNTLLSKIWFTLLLIVLIIALVIALGGTLSSCGEKPLSSVVDEPLASISEHSPTTARWYSTAQVEQGEQVFLAHCATCHGDKAQGTVANWRARLENGKFPPPPLNGNAHAWHHPMSVLVQTISDGGIALGGSMPAFGSALNEQQKSNAVAYFQSFWSDDTYASWESIDASR